MCCASWFCQSHRHRRKVKNTMETRNYLFIIVTFVQCCSAVENNCLNNLKISELLRFKHSVDLLSCSKVDAPLPTSPTNATNSTSSMTTNGGLRNDGPSALPLTNARSYPEPWQEKPTKLQTLFQVSITALAFLSFGGYLLCLIVQAIKSKGTTYFHPVTTGTNTNSNGQLKKIKIFRRSRRMANVTEEVNYADDYSLAGPNPEDLYKTLLYFAEGYASNVGNFK